MIKVLEAFGEPISFGGQESFVMNAISHMDPESFSFDLLTPYYCDNERYRARVRDYGGEVFELGVAFNPGGDRRNIVDPVSRFFERGSYDVVHVHSGSTSALAFLAKAAKRRAVRTVITHSHVGVEHFGLKNRLVREVFSRGIARNADILCACSQLASEAKYPPRLQSRVRIIKNGIDLPRFHYDEEKRKNIRQKLGFSDDAFVVGHVGRFSYQKNHEYLIEVFREIARAEENAKLLLVGDGEGALRARELVSAYGLDDSVVFTGNVGNVNEMLQGMDVFAFPSRFEGLPIVLVEAQAAGLPIVASDKVTNEVRVSGAFRFLPIGGSDAPRWVDTLLGFRNFSRADGSQAIREAGFDIESVACELSGMYEGSQLATGNGA